MKKPTREEIEACEAEIASFMLYSAAVRSPDIQAMRDDFRDKIIALSQMAAHLIRVKGHQKLVKKSTYRTVFKSLLKN